MIEFRLPSLGADMDKGKLLEWLVKPGDTVAKGQIVCIVDTAKAAIDVECWHDGVVHALLVQPDSTIPVGTLMAALREPGESTQVVDAALARLLEHEAVSPLPPGAEVAAGLPPTPPTPAPIAGAVEERLRVSPAARKRAAELGIDLLKLTGSGVGGAVTLEDVQRFAASVPSAALPKARTGAPMADRAQEMRKVIAAAMARSKREIPHYYLAEDVPLANTMAWLDTQNAGRGVTERLLLAPLLLKAVSLALRRCPELNGYFRDGAFEPGTGIHIGVAISLRTGGLVSPALLDVDRKDIDHLNRELLDLIKRARAGSLRRTELTDATINVTSLGDQGVGAVFGVIYPPQVALVGFGRVTTRPWIVEGSARPVPVITASLAADHRVSDGHRGGLFLAAVRELLQTPNELSGS
jgi:pyruvate dehydrogenase E2 component (dihydrolipoamide acetyltransferase)